MARQIEDMTEPELREELERRAHPGPRNPDIDDASRRPFGYGRTTLRGGGYGWPFLPPPYPGLGHGPYPPPTAEWRRGPGRYGAGWAPRESYGRGFLERAGDEIASWLDRDDAEARREADHRGRGPKGYVRSDARIEEDVNDRLTDDPYVDASDIEVSVEKREVTLNGTVRSRFAKRAAEDCVELVSGVAHVQNNLRVQRDTA